MAFSGAFGAAFSHPVLVGYICPVMAGAAIAAGAAVQIEAGRVRIGGAQLIGMAGKVFQFSSDAAAQKWCDVAAARLAYEPVALAGMSPPAREAWIAKKRVRMAEVARLVVLAASSMQDAGKRAALVAESNYCLSKWG